MLQTDYIDFGFIHCIDEQADLDKIKQAGVLDYILSLKKQGIIKHIGLSSHTPQLVHQVLDLNILDMLMFSINPAYDYRHGTYAIGNTDERLELYRRCQKEGVAISVMKAFSGGQLLDPKKSPCPQALTETQYCFTRNKKPTRFKTHLKIYNSFYSRKRLLYSWYF